MLTRLKIWFNTTFLNKVTFDSKGKPYDCKGLRFNGGKPFEECVEYYLTNNWDKWDYLGKGIYVKPTRIKSDTGWKSF